MSLVQVMWLECAFLVTRSDWRKISNLFIPFLNSVSVGLPVHGYLVYISFNLLISDVNWFNQRSYSSDINHFWSWWHLRADEFYWITPQSFSPVFCILTLISHCCRVIREVLQVAWSTVSNVSSYVSRFLESRSGDRVIPCGAPVLLTTTSDGQLCSHRYWQIVSIPWCNRTGHPLHAESLSHLALRQQVWSCWGQMRRYCYKLAQTRSPV